MVRPDLGAEVPAISQAIGTYARPAQGSREATAYPVSGPDATRSVRGVGWVNACTPEGNSDGS